jgi:hypothetical protein
MICAGGGEGQRRENGESTYHAFSTPQKKCQKPLGYLYRRKIHRLASTLGRLSSAMRAGLHACQTGGRPGLRTCKRKGETAQSSTGGRTHRLVTSPAGVRGKGKRQSCTQRDANNRRASWASCVSHSGRLLGACETHTATRVGRRYGRRSGVGLWKRRDALARVGVVHVMHPEASLFPDSWGRPIASCLLRSGNTSLAGCVRSIAAMGRDRVCSGGITECYAAIRVSPPPPSRARCRIPIPTDWSRRYQVESICDIVT